MNVTFFKTRKKIDNFGRTIWESKCGKFHLPSEEIIEKISKKEIVLLEKDKDDNYFFKILKIIE